MGSVPSFRLREGAEVIDDMGEAEADSGGPESGPGDELRRERVRRRRRRRPSFLQRWWVELALLLLAVMGLSLILFSLPLFAMPAEGSENGGFLPAWQRMLPFAGVMFLFVSLIGGALRLRYRVNYHEEWWIGPCPQCQKGELKRKRRRYGDRLLGRLGMPVRRYACEECQWEGARIDQSRV